MTEIIDIALLIGRLLFGGFFLLSGVKHFTGLDQMVPYAESKNVPLARLAVPATGLLMLLGATSVVLGLYPRIGLGLIALFLIGTTPTMHDYWTQEDPQARMNERTHFLKNTALLGATLALMALSTPWTLALAL